MDAAIVASNLRRLRAGRRSSQDALARAAGLSRSGYRKIEMGEVIPRGATLQALADALRVPVKELVAPTSILRRVRFRSSKQLKRRDEVLVRVANRLADYRELEEVLEIPGAPALPCPKSADPKAAAAEARAAFGLADKEPVRDVCGLLESRGIKVIAVPVASDGFFGLSVAGEDGGPAVAVNTWNRISVERWIFSAAHELAHLLLHHADYDVTRREEEKKSEKDANLFASHFLMPDEGFRAEWESAAGLGLVDRVLKVKRIYRVSWRTVLYRLQELGVSDQGIWPRFQAAYRRQAGTTLGGHDEPLPLKKVDFAPESSRAKEPEHMADVDFVQDRLFRLVREAVEADAITLSRAAEVLEMPLPAMRELSASWVA